MGLKSLRFLSSLLAASILVSALPPSLSWATEFVIVGPRAVGMGGTGVATTTDALATYWNPAGLAMSDDENAQIQGSAQVVDRGGLLDTLDAINSINPSDLSQLGNINGLLARLSGTSVSAGGAAGLYFKGSTGNHAFGLNISDVATSGLFAPGPITASISGPSIVINGELTANALEARQAVFSYAYSLPNKILAIGVSGKVIQGAAYSNSVAVFSAGNEFDFSGDLGKAVITHHFGVDVGAVFRPASWLRMGIVGKDLNEPTFDAPGGGKFKLGPQVRAGVALNPYRSLTIAFDADVTSNKTLVPGVKSQMLSLGAEQTLLSDTLSLRAGALADVQQAKTDVTPTAGLGLRILGLHLDVAGGYDFNQRGALLGASASLKF